VLYRGRGNSKLSFNADPDFEKGKDMSEGMRRNRIHTHMHNEMQNLEIAAQTLVDFADAPVGTPHGTGPQCWDESRHSAVLLRRLQEMGGHKGEFPVMHYEWNITCMQDSLAARLAIQNRTVRGRRDGYPQRCTRNCGATRATRSTAGLLEGILSDEIHHVRFANVWLKRLAKMTPASC
jgi:uncharacterized ferritin-like protein (DUF455 family)